MTKANRTKAPAVLHAVYERDESGIWLVHLREEPRVATFGRTLVRAEQNMRDAAALWYQADAHDIRLQHDYEGLPSFTWEALERMQRERIEAAEAQRRVVDTTRDAARRLVHEAGLSVRDAAHLLGVSHQRVHQLVAD